MDRLIQVKVKGFHLSKDSSAGGVQGEANITTLRIEFDEGWDGFDKTLYFLNAKGELPVKIDLTATLLAGERTYDVLIPGEALREGGWFSFILEGAVDSVVQRSIEGKLYAEPVEDYEGAQYPQGVENPTGFCVFYATYGVTTFEEIRAAYDAGKAVYVFSGIYGDGMIGSLVNISGEAVFAALDGWNNMLFICDSNGWAQEEFVFPGNEPKPSAIDVTETADDVTFTTTFADGSTKVRVITKDAEGNPSGMTDDGEAVAVSWTEVEA